VSHVPRSYRQLGTSVDAALRDRVRATNATASRSQSIKGFFTAGPLKSAAYAAAKLRKRLTAVTHQ